MNFRRVITSSNLGMYGILEKQVENTSKLQNKRTNLCSKTATPYSLSETPSSIAPEGTKLSRINLPQHEREWKATGRK
jgi:hypothetical protein